MKKELLALSICLLLLFISFSGCLEQNQNEIGEKQTELPSDEFCFYPFCDLVPKIYDLTSLDNPSNYLGDRIACESHSDWKNYTPLIQKSNEIISGESSDHGKAMTLARYVKHSKEYGFPSPANEHKTVIDIYESPTGVCLDASILLTAMLRIAGIPAKSVTSSISFHEFNKVFVNDTWITVDATFGEGEPITNFSGLGYFVTLVSGYNGTFHDVMDHRKVMFKEAHLHPNTYTSSDIVISKYGQGTIAYPVVSKTLYVTISSNLSYDLSNLSVEKQDEWSAETWFSTSAFEIIDDFGKTDNNYKALGVPGFYYWAISEYNDTYNNTWSGNARCTGYFKTFLPAFRYRLYYNFYGDHKVAYVDFEIKDGETTIIRSEDFKKIPDASQNNFDVFMSLINVLPSYEYLT